MSGADFDAGATVAFGREEQLTAATGQGTSPSMPPRIGRYVVVDRLGAGGMGVVYTAYDKELDRRVAVKVLWPGPAKQPRERQRLILEARAMARLAHENVVPVYDVGEVDGQVYLAMELVEGQSLSQWLETRARPWRDVVAAFVQAGRGLAAAHAAGLVHRDFKPHNALIGDAPAGQLGRVRVTDFGLALLCEPAALPSTDTPATTGLTRTGVVMGSPAYMAPEQHRGEGTDARSDQYSFCVSLYEGLFGVRPFRAGSLDGLARAKRRAQLSRPAKPEIPGRLWHALVRGLRPDPAERFESMADLLVELEAAGAPRRRAAWIGPLVLLIGAAAAVDPWPTKTACADAHERLAGTWDAEQRGAVRKVLSDPDVGYADATRQTVVSMLDRHAQRWMDAYEEICDAGQGTSGRVLDARMSCLQDRHRELDALVQVLTHADRGVIANATNAVAGLQPIDDCYAANSSPTSPPAALAPAVDQLRGRLAHVRALDRAGKYDDAAGELQGLRADVRAVHFAPLDAELQLATGILAQHQGRYDDAAKRLHRAYWTASGAGADAIASEAATWLVRVVGYDQARIDDALEWARHARAAVFRAGASDLLEGMLQYHVGTAAFRAGRFEDSRAAVAASLRIRERHLGPDHPDVGMSLDALGNTLRSMGRPEEALEFHNRALEIHRRVFGDEHPTTAATFNNIGIAHAILGEMQTAREYMALSVEILEQTLGRDNLRVARNVINLASVDFHLGHHARALVAMERSLPVLERELGSDHPDVADLLKNLGNVAEKLGDTERAIAAEERALRIYESAFGPHHATIGLANGNLGNALATAGRREEAEVAYAKAVRSLESYEDQFHLGLALWGRGRNDLARDRPARAVRWLERAMQTEGSHADNPGLYVDLATALQRTDPRSARICELAGGASCRSDELSDEQRTRARRIVDDHCAAHPVACDG